MKSAGRLRLTRREVERWTRITGFEPVGIRSLDDLVEYVRACKAYYWGTSQETRFLHWLIDEEFRRCTRMEDRGVVQSPRTVAGTKGRRDQMRSIGLQVYVGGRAALERELLWLVALGNSDAPRAVELSRILDARKSGALRLIVGDRTDASDGALPVESK